MRVSHTHPILKLKQKLRLLLMSSFKSKTFTTLPKCSVQRQIMVESTLFYKTTKVMFFLYLKSVSQYV
ncbi:hypothetical protein D0N73_12875 [Pseudomonas fluorescens]|nr:hypothetical protein B0A76_02895 [Pseudomonas fluorescens]RFP95747.1 hypothetical protein D0N73_12875 [Pseudomonas fluorescens]